MQDLLQNRTNRRRKEPAVERNKPFTDAFDRLALPVDDGRGGPASFCEDNALRRQRWLIC
jgi:hypothetical protein